MSQTRYLKSMITPTLVEPTTSDANIVGVASGVWSVQDQLEARRGGAWPDASVANPDEFIENNFSIDLYAGNNGTQTITNGIDFANKGGLVWVKSRSARDHYLFDTVRGGSKDLNSNDNSASVTDQSSAGITSFNSNGYALTNTYYGLSTNNENFVNWSFKKAPKFFDIVTYTGNGGDLTVNHNLGSVPGMIIIKCTSAVKSWAVYHRGVNGGSSPEDYALFLNTTGAQNDNLYFQDTAPTSTQFFLGDSVANENGETHVAYIFGHETGSDSMIHCGSFDNTSNVTVDCGFEPQWVLVKGTDTASNWFIFDAMRQNGDDGITLFPNLSNAEASQGTSDGGSFFFKSNGFFLNDYVLGDNIDSGIYVAIRRPNMATITDATEVFAMDTQGASAPYFDSGFPVDMAFYRPTSSDHTQIASRITGTGRLYANLTSSEGSSSGHQWDYMDGWYGSAINSNQSWMWKRAKGYFDVVAYTGNSASSQTIVHSLQVVPEMIWTKNRDQNGYNWIIYHKHAAAVDGTGSPEDLYLSFNNNSGVASNTFYYASTSPTNENFYVGRSAGSDDTNRSTYTYISYLFSTLAGVSKVGGIAHSGSSTDVDCGFSTGARFVMLKRRDAAGNWFFWDSVRGIIAGNDPYLLLNDSAAQVTNTDYIDPLASGFQISGNFTDGDYIFYAIA